MCIIHTRITSSLGGNTIIEFKKNIFGGGGEVYVYTNTETVHTLMDNFLVSHDINFYEGTTVQIKVYINS